MTAVLIVLSLVAVAIAAGVVYGCDRMLREQAAELARVWQLASELEDDKRALTESLCRAEGKPFIIPISRAPRLPSEGWFDGKPQVVAATTPTT